MSNYSPQSAKEIKSDKGWVGVQVACRLRTTLWVVSRSASGGRAPLGAATRSDSVGILNPYNKILNRCCPARRLVGLANAELGPAVA